MRNILKSAIAHRAFQALCFSILSGPSAAISFAEIPIDQTAIAADFVKGIEGFEVDLIRGGIFFLTMVTWGSRRVKSLEASFGIVLSAMSTALRQKIKEAPWSTGAAGDMLAYELSLSIRRLVKRHGESLRVEWDIVVSILMQLDLYVARDKGGLITQVLRETLSCMEALFHANTYFGDENELFVLMEHFKDVCSESSSILILSHRVIPIPLVMSCNYEC